MKRVIFAIICILTVFAFAGCNAEVYDPPLGNDRENESTTRPVPPPEEAEKYSVDLSYGGEKYIPTQKMTAIFMGMGIMVSADFDLTTGVAEIEGLDGDYHIMLDGLPEEMSYDNNAYTIGNDSRHVTVELDPIIETYVGVDNQAKFRDALYSAPFLNGEGTYRCILNGENSRFFCSYEPDRAGLYTISSRMDITANEVNPKVDLYTGHAGIILYFNRSQDGGGLSSTYTKNFLMSIEVSSDMVGNNLTFAVYAENRGDSYPIEIDFTIKREGNDTIVYPDYEGVIAQGPFADKEKMKSDIDGKGFHWFDRENGGVLDESNIKLNPADGFYYMWDGVSYGNCVYAVLNAASPVLDAPFLDPLVIGGLRWNGKYYGSMISAYVNDKCYTARGYHPVNDELKEFLQGYAEAQLLFMDGNGWAEEAGGVKSDEKSMWLFACGYFE